MPDDLPAVPEPDADASPWNERDRAVALALARGESRQKAANSGNCSARTVYTLMADPAFRALVEQYRAEMIGEAIGRLASVSGKAAETLEALLGSQSETVRLNAARIVLEAMIRVREHAELAERIARLEDYARHQSQAWGP